MRHRRSSLEPNIRAQAVQRAALLTERPDAPDKTLQPVTLTCDGACVRNGRPDAVGGWAFVLRRNGEAIQRSGRVSERATSIRMELQAFIEGLLEINRPSEITLVSDSQYLLTGIERWRHKWRRNGWLTVNKQPVANQDQWKIIDALLADHEVICEWIRGHLDLDEDQTRCDEIAEARAASPPPRVYSNVTMDDLEKIQGDMSVPYKVQGE